MSGRQKIMTQPIVRAAAVASEQIGAPASSPACSAPCCPGLPALPSRNAARHTDFPAASVATQNLIFRYLQSKVEVEIWLFEQTDMRIRGRIIVSGGDAACSAPARAGVDSPAVLAAGIRRVHEHGAGRCEGGVDEEEDGEAAGCALDCRAR